MRTLVLWCWSGMRERVDCGFENSAVYDDALAEHQATLFAIPPQNLDENVVVRFCVLILRQSSVALMTETALLSTHMKPEWT